jgi:hypothetical protein
VVVDYFRSAEVEHCRLLPPYWEPQDRGHLNGVQAFGLIRSQEQKTECLVANQRINKGGILMFAHGPLFISLAPWMPGSARDTNVSG